MSLPVEGDYGPLDDSGYWVKAETREDAIDAAAAIDEPDLLDVSAEKVLINWLPDDHYNRPGLMSGEYECPDDPDDEWCKHTEPIWVWEVHYKPEVHAEP